MYISWCANEMTLRNARCNDKDNCINVNMSQLMHP